MIFQYVKSLVSFLEELSMGGFRGCDIEVIVEVQLGNEDFFILLFWVFV